MTINVCAVSGCGNSSGARKVCADCYRWAANKLGERPTTAQVFRELGVQSAPTRLPRTGSRAFFRYWQPR